MRCWPRATFPGAGSAKGVGRGGTGGTSVPQCQGVGVAQTLLQMCNLSGESGEIFNILIKSNYFLWMRRIRKVGASPRLRLPGWWWTRGA